MTSVTTLAQEKYVRFQEHDPNNIEPVTIFPVDKAETAAHSVEDGQMNLDTIAAFYDETFPLVYRYIARRVGHDESASDLTSEVFSRFLRANSRGQCPDKSPKSWLYRTAHNVVIDFFRRQKHRQHLQLDENIPQSDADPLTLAEDQLLAGIARKALTSLTPDQQQVISLRFLEGLSIAEVADVVEKSVGAVKSLQHRGLKALQRQLIPTEEEVPTWMKYRTSRLNAL